MLLPHVKVVVISNQMTGDIVKHVQANVVYLKGGCCKGMEFELVVI